MLRRKAVSLCFVASASWRVTGRAAASVAPPPTDRRLEVRPLATSPLLESGVLAVAPIGEDRLAVLALHGLRVYRARGAELVRLSEYLLPDVEPVRNPGGLLLAKEDTIWILRSGAPRAVLLAIDAGGGLSARLEADAIPWPGCPAGLRYRAGTDLLEGDADGLGEGPFLAVAPGVAVDPDGRLEVASSEGARPSSLRAGAVLVDLGDALLAATGASPPGPSDQILFLEHEDGELRLLQEVTVPGTVRGLAAARGPASTRLVAALSAEGRSRLASFEIRRTRP